MPGSPWTRQPSSTSSTSAQNLLEHLNGFTARLSTAQTQGQGQQRAPSVRNIEADCLVTLLQPVEIASVRRSGSQE